jgi:hypothetical protein
MEKGGVRPCANGFEDRVSIPNVALYLPHAGISRGLMEKGIQQNDLIDGFKLARRPRERSPL